MDDEQTRTTVGDVATYSATLDRFVAASRDGDGIQIDRLAPLTELVVRTRHSTYEILVADPQRSRIILRGGRNFPFGTPATLRGSTLGGHCLKIGWIGPGFNMEIQAGAVVAVTSPVQSIRFGRLSPERGVAEEDNDAPTDVKRDAHRADSDRAGLDGVRVEH